MNLVKYSREKLVKKTCCFEGCTTEFESTTKAKYCDEHRKSKYRRIIDREKILQKKQFIIDNNQNIIIEHDYTSPVEVRLICQCCDEEYSIILYPNTFTYPKFCEDHRNEFKRLWYFKQIGVIETIPENKIELESIDDKNFEDEIIPEDEIIDISLIKEINDDFLYN